MTTLINTLQAMTTKKAVNKSSNLATRLELFEMQARDTNKMHGSFITRNNDGLITKVRFFYNHFYTVTKGVQNIFWHYITIVE